VNDQGGDDQQPPATTTTTKKPGTPGIPLADEPTFSSVTVQASYHCPTVGAGSIPMSWTTTDTEYVYLRVDADPPFHYNDTFDGGTISTTISAPCDDASDTLHVQLQATGPGGSAVASRTIAVTKP
jgi:hypothetical protein